MKLFSKQPKPSPEAARQPRRRTLPAGQNRTFSYYAARSQTELNLGREMWQDKPPLRRLPTRLQRLRRHAGWLAGAVLLLAFGIFQMQLSTSPRVVSLMSASDAPFLQDSAVYQAASRKLFNASAANHNKLTVNATAIATSLRQQFPELQEVSVSLPLFGNQPTVYVRPAKPALLLAASNGSYVVDENGRALAEATANTNLSGLKVPSVTDQSNLQVKLGQQVLPRTATDFVGLVSSQFAKQKLGIQSMTLPAAAGELDVYLSGKPYFVKFNLQPGQQGQQGSTDSAAVQIGTFLALIKKLEKQGTPPAQYVDVRLEGRAYYK
jgi:cell division septal protein FtsQ